MLIGPEVASGTREINRHNAYYFSTQALADKRVCIYSSDNSLVVFGVRRLNLFCSLRREASASDSVVVFWWRDRKNVEGERKQNDRWYKSAAASDTAISIWQVRSTQMHNLGASECKYVQAGSHECTSAIHHPQDADSFPPASCLLPTHASELLLSFLREISRKDQFACLFLLVEPVIGLGGDHKGFLQRRRWGKNKGNKIPRSIRGKQLTAQFPHARLIKVYSLLCLSSNGYKVDCFWIQDIY